MDKVIDRYLRSATQQPFFYIVKSGDTLSKIIYQHYNVVYQDRVRYAHAQRHLQYLNPALNNPDLIRVGEVLHITPLPSSNFLTYVSGAPNEVLGRLPVLADTAYALKPIAAPLSLTPTSPEEHGLFWTLSWLQHHDWLTVPGGITFGAAGNLFNGPNIDLVSQVKTLYNNYKAGRITKTQYDYGRQRLLKEFSQKVGPLERLLFDGRTTPEAIRIARAGGIPATHNITSNVHRLARLAKVAKVGGVVLTGVGAAAGCAQIAATNNKVEKNEIFVETAMSTSASIVAGAVLYFVLVSNPVGWAVALVLAAGSAVASYGAGKVSRHIYTKGYQHIDLTSAMGINKICQ